MAKHTKYYPEIEDIGNRIDKLRIENNMTQEQLADVMKCERKTVCRIVNGVGCFNLYYIINICKHFEVSADWLIFGSEKEQE